MFLWIVILYIVTLMLLWYSIMNTQKVISLLKSGRQIGTHGGKKAKNKYIIITFLKLNSGQQFPKLKKGDGRVMWPMTEKQKTISAVRGGDAQMICTGTKLCSGTPLHFSPFCLSSFYRDFTLWHLYLSLSAPDLWFSQATTGENPVSQIFFFLHYSLQTRLHSPLVDQCAH